MKIMTNYYEVTIASWALVLFLQQLVPLVSLCLANRPFSCSKIEFESNDVLIHFIEFSNLNNKYRGPNGTQASHSHETMISFDPGSFAQ